MTEKEIDKMFKLLDRFMYSHISTKKNNITIIRNNCYYDLDKHKKIEYYIVTRELDL